MGSKALKLRTNWQNKSGKVAKQSEQSVTDVLRSILPSDKYIVDEQIHDFKNEYSKVKLPNYISSKIYNPGEKTIKKSHWGWVPDNSITNIKTNKKIFIEVKKQDGWTKDTIRKAGRGNAHERGLKHFAPGILNKEKEASHITDDFLPFIIIYVGNITLDPRRNREIYFWFQGHEDNYFMWHTNDNNELIIDDLKKYIYEKVLPHLE